MSFDLGVTRNSDFSEVTFNRQREASIHLAQALELADTTFSIERMLEDGKVEFVNSYYKQSLIGYSRIYNPWQCMHVALHEPDAGEEAAFFAQAAAVSEVLGDGPGQRVLELGCGLGANTLHLAARHPAVEFAAVDLMDDHVTRATDKARGLTNARFHCASFESLPESLGTFDVIFAVETLCYARSLDKIAASLARHLRPGGLFILFDAHRKAGFNGYPASIVTATRLYEIATAVTRGFHAEGAWEAAFTAVGLTLEASEDITWKTHQGLATLQRRALKAFTNPRWRMALRVMPRYLARNTVAGLLGYPVCFGDSARPDPAQGAIAYHKIVVRKPLD